MGQTDNDTSLLLRAGASKAASAQLMAMFGTVHAVSQASRAELQAAGCTPRMAERLSVAFEIGRVGLMARDAPTVIGSPEDTYAHLRSKIATAPQESFYVLAVNIRNQLIDTVEIARGTVCGVEVHPRDVFRCAVRLNAAGIVLAHNHPSGDPTPSPDDIALTRRLKECGIMIGIPVLDHVVVASSGYRSIMEWMGASL